MPKSGKKNIVQDVIPPKRSIRNVTLPSRSRRTKEDPHEKESHSRLDLEAPIRIESRIESRPEPKMETIKVVKEEPKEEPRYEPAPNFSSESEFSPKAESKSSQSISSSYPYAHTTAKKSSRKALYTVVFFLLVAFAFGLSALFRSAEIRITPKEQTVSVSSTFTAKKDATGDDLGFQVVSITKGVEKTVAANGQEHVEKKATGKVILYNTYSTTPQKLIATTRLETPEGLIYHIANAVNIPGYQTKDGKVVAGSIEVAVEADKVGESYNVPLKDFTVPGLKGDARYSKIYARSSTPMTGGFSGNQKMVSAAARSSAETELGASLQSSLSNDIATQIPANFVLYPGSISYDLSPLEEASVASGNTDTANAVLRKSGTAKAVIFDKAALSRVILAKVSSSFSSSAVQVTNLNALNFSYPTTTPFDPGKNTSLTFSLSGDAHLVWTVDANKLKTDLLGLSKKDAKTTISNYDVIQEAWITTRPFWSQTVPSDPQKVTIVNTLSQAEAK